MTIIIMPRNKCRRCQSPITQPKTGYRKFCSPACQTASWKERHQTAPKPPKPRNCAECGAPFHACPTKKFCGDPCRNRYNQYHRCTTCGSRLSYYDEDMGGCIRRTHYCPTCEPRKE